MYGTNGFTVVTVCTGNICRSPAAERLIQRQWVGSAPDVQVVSAGVEAVVGAPIQISMAHLIEQSGAYSGEFSAQSLTAEVLDEADLVLGMTRRHRGAIANQSPAALPHTFTLLEFARLVEAARGSFAPTHDRAADLRRLVALASSQRGPVAEPALDDIADPYGGDLDGYIRAFDQIAAAVAGVTAVLDGVEPEVLTPDDNEPTETRASRRQRRRRGH